MFTPYPYQKRCLVVLKETRAQGKNVALIIMASGLGKTFTVAFDVLEWLKKNKGRILYLCHQNDILGQAKKTFESVLGSGYSYGFFTGQEKTAHKADCLFASFQTMSVNAQWIFSPDEFGYIVVDESHHSQAPSHLRIVEYFKPKFLLGATATPDRADKLDIRTVFGEEVFELPLEKALAQGLLTKVDYRLVTDEISLDHIDSAELDKFSLKDIDHKVFIPKRDEEIAASIDRHSAELSEPTIVVFASSITRANQLVERIPSSAAIHSKIPIKERLVTLEMFRQGMIPTVITVDCFNEGIDIPEANMVVFLRSTASERIFYQQLGRGLRLSPGKDKVIVLDFVGNVKRISMLRELADAIALQHSVEMTAGGNKENSFNIKFDEKAQRVLDIVKRIRKCVADVPELIREYSPRNPLPASKVLVKSWSDMVWWTCGACKKEWQTSPAAKRHGRTCPNCELPVTRTTSLQFVYPILAAEYTTKNPLPADQIRANTTQMVWWKCRKCSNEYAARPHSRTTRGDGCPACAARVAEYKDNVAFTSPKLALEYSEVNTLSPENVGVRSTDVCWWTCSDCGHSYQASPQERDDGKECPACCTESS
jgi:superfamily II DNA or RNA helicase